MPTPFNFLGIPPIKPQAAQVVILPVPFEQTTSYGQGTKNGPKAIIEASRQVELYDPSFGDEIQNLVPVATAPPVKGGLKSLNAAAAKYQNSFLISLGGEHSITPELIKPFFKKCPDLSVLQIDSHTDMRNSFAGSKFSHACAMRRVQELGIKQIVQVGIRNTAKKERKSERPNGGFWTLKLKPS